MKRILAIAGLILAIGLGPASAQNITKSLQGAQDPRGPVGIDTSNAIYLPGHLNSFGQFTTAVSPGSCGSGGNGTITASAFTDVAGKITPRSTACSIFFGSPFNVPPACIVQAEGVSVALPVSTFTTVTTTGFNMTSTSSGTVYDYICIGQQ